MSLDVHSFDELAAFGERLTDASRAVIGRYFRQSLDIDAKGDETPVTVADRETEQALRQLIEAEYPEHGIFGEEFADTRPDSRFSWIIDPIDGTRAFITGTPTFGTLISLVDEGVPVFGIIDQPALDERWMGGGGTVRVNGKACEVSGRTQLDGCRLVVTSPDMFVDGQVDAFRRLLTHTSFYRYGGDCYNYALLASGHVDLVVESDLQPYDFCALAPVVESAGGVISDWQGQPITRHSPGHVIAAASPELHRQALAELQTAFSD